MPGREIQEHRGNGLLDMLLKSYTPPSVTRRRVLASAISVAILLILSGSSVVRVHAQQTDEQRASLQRHITVAQALLGDQPQFRQQVERFYEAIHFRLAWLHNGEPSSQARTLIDLFQKAQQKGLVPGDYGNWTEELRTLHRPNGDRTAQQVDFDLDLTVAAMRYISDLHFGRVRSAAMGFDLGQRGEAFSIAEFLRQHILDASDVPRTIESVEPPFPGYKRTLAALQTLQWLAARGKSKPLGIPRKTIRPGETYSELQELAARLRLLGDLDVAVPDPSGSTYTVSIVNAVRRFQARHALAPTGQLDRATVQALNVPLKKRVEQLELTLERWRWVPQHLVPPLIIVNIPEFELHAVGDNYHWMFSQRVVLGRSYQHKTPVFIGQIQSVTFRPYWNVPLSIQRAEIVPHVLKNPNYLAKHDYQVVTRGSVPIPLSTVTSSAIHALRSGEWKVRQLPGPENALGLVRFNFPNQYGVYMHGTPSPELFRRSRRDFSHGCIRVEDPLALAAWVLHADPHWTPQSIDTAMHGEQTITVNLQRPLEVLIIYGTAVVPETGEIHFLPDIYGYDSRLKAALERQRRSPIGLALNPGK